MIKHCLFKRIKDEYLDSFNDYIKEFPSHGDFMVSELMQNIFVSKLTYGCIVNLQSATQHYGSPFHIFKEISDDV